MSQKPSLGRIVHYSLSKRDIEKFLIHAKPGDVVPAIITKVDALDGSVCMKLFVNDIGDVWIPEVKMASVDNGSEHGKWFWPPRV